MDRWRAPESIWVAVIVAVALLTGPAVGIVQVGEDPPQLGSGDATVADVAFDGELSIDRGRFGTGVYYVRAPTAEVVVASATDAPRLRYRVRISGLSYDESTTRVLDGTASGRYRLALPTVGVPPERVSEDAYDGHVSLTVQSFETDKTVAQRRVDVVVGR